MAQRSVTEGSEVERLVGLSMLEKFIKRKPDIFSDLAEQDW